MTETPPNVVPYPRVAGAPPTGAPNTCPTTRCSDNPGPLWAALGRAQQAFGALKRSKQGQTGHQTYKYAPLDELIEVTRPALAAEELVVFFAPRTTRVDGTVVVAVDTYLTRQGEWFCVSLDVELPANATPKTIGSAQTYLSRYGYKGVVGISDEDDDGATLDQPTGAPRAAARPAPASRPPTAASGTPDEGFPAKLPGTCEACGEAVTPGQRITKGAPLGHKGYIHVACATPFTIEADEAPEEVPALTDKDIPW